MAAQRRPAAKPKPSFVVTLEVPRYLHVAAAQLAISQPDTSVEDVYVRALGHYLEWQALKVEDRPRWVDIANLCGALRSHQRTLERICEALAQYQDGMIPAAYQALLDAWKDDV